MPDLSRVITGFADIGGMVWAAGSQTLFFTSNGALNFLNPSTGATGGLGLTGIGAASDLDISADGRFILVGDKTARPPLNGVAADGIGTYYRVTLSTGQVDAFNFRIGYSYESSAADIVVLANGRGLLSTNASGGTALRIFDATATAPTAEYVPNITVSAPLVEVSESHRYALVIETNSSSGPFSLYDSTTSTIVRSRVSLLPNHPFGASLREGDIHEGTGRIALAGDSSTLIVTDLSFKLVADLSFDFKITAMGVQFSPDGQRLMVSQLGSDLIAVFDTTSWKQLGSYRLQAKLTDNAFSHDGTMAFSNDGRLLFVDTSTGVEVIDLSARSLASDGGVAVPRTQLTDPFVLAAGETVNREGIGYYLNSTSAGPVTMLSIAGELNITGSSATAVNAQLGGHAQRFIIERGGAVHVTASSSRGSASGYSAGGFDGASFANHGLLVVTSAGEAFGVESYALKGDYTNTGTIRVTGGEIAWGFRLSNLNEPYAFRNSGTIEVHDAGGQYGRSWGVVLPSAVTAFHNLAGGSIIVAHDSPSTGRNIAVHITPAGSSPGSLNAYTNAGLIQGDIALELRVGTTDGIINHQRIFDNQATGVLRGEVILAGNGATLANAGVVEGSVTMGAYAEFYDGSRGGRVTGMVSAGAGDDLMYGGPAFDYLQGNSGRDRAYGGGGDDWVVGGKDDDDLAGDAGADLVYGNLGNDTCDGGDGADVVRGGQDNDVLRGGTGNDYMSGDKGEDTIAGGTGADVFHTFGEAGMDRVVDFNLAEGDRVLLDSGTQYTLAQVGADTVISMAGGGQMVLTGVQMSTLTTGWIFGA